MDSIEVKEMPSSTTAPGVSPSHKITYTDGSERHWFYYFMRTPECRPFVRVKDDELVKQMYARGQELQVEGFISFSVGPGLDYHLQRLSPHVFTITALR